MSDLSEYGADSPRPTTGGHSRAASHRREHPQRPAARTFKALDAAVAEALPDHAAALTDASAAISEWQQTRARYQRDTERAMAVAGNARAVLTAMLLLYRGDNGRAVARDVVPPLRGEHDLERFAQPLDLLDLLDQRAQPQQGKYDYGKPVRDTVGANAERAAANIRAALARDAVA
jgi:hypothetical protein